MTQEQAHTTAKNVAVIPITKSTVVSMSLGLLISVGAVVWLAATDRAEALHAIEYNAQVNEIQAKQIEDLHTRFEAIQDSIIENQRALDRVESAIQGIGDNIKRIEGRP